MNEVHDDLDAPAPGSISLGLWKRIIGTALQDRRSAVQLVGGGIGIAAMRSHGCKSCNLAISIADRRVGWSRGSHPTAAK